MSIHRIALAALAMACTPDGAALHRPSIDETSPVAGVPGARRSVALTVSGFVHTAPMTVTVTGLNPGELVRIARSSGTGIGPCPAVAGGTCLSLGGGAQLMGSAVADATGTASLTVTVPAVADGVHLALQALVVRGVGGVDSVVTPVVEGDIAAPAVDADGDGFTADDDCDDADATVFPGALEICDDRDNDCDPQTGEDGLVSANGVNYASVSDAAFAAAIDTTVAICAGVFSGNVALDHSVDLRGRGPGITVLEGDGTDDVVKLSQIDGAAIEALTITGGASFGIDASNADDLVLADLHLDGNGLRATGHSQVRRVEIDDSPTYGAQIGANTDATDIEDLTIRRPLSVGLYFNAFEPMTCSRCVVLDTDDLGVWALVATDSMVTMTDSRIEGSAGSASHHAGGLELFDGGSMHVERTDIVGNEGEAGGVFVRDGSTLTLVDVALHANIATATGGGIFIEDGTVELVDTDFGLGLTENAPDDIDGAGFSGPIGYFVGATTATCTESGC